mgnify:CR=1 FL=1
MLKIEFPQKSNIIQEEYLGNFEYFLMDYYVNETLAAVTEIKHNNTTTHIQSLVVRPDFFRKGIAQKLIDFTLKTHNSPLITVETGADNLPASQLYVKMGFTETRKWMTEHDIVKVGFEKRQQHK